jgi:hypothetical protein
MKTPPRLGSLARTCGAGALAALSGLVFFFPRIGTAEGEDERYGKDGYIFADVTTSVYLTEAEGTKNGWIVHCNAKNETDEPKELVLFADVTQATYRGLARTAGPGKTIWKIPVTLTLAPHEELDTNVDVPKWIADALRANSRRNEQESKNGITDAVLMSPHILYGVKLEWQQVPKQKAPDVANTPT